MESFFNILIGAVVGILLMIVSKGKKCVDQLDEALDDAVTMDSDKRRNNIKKFER